MAESGIPTIEVPHPDPRWEDPIYSGYVVKRGNHIKHWARRFVILTREGELWYFANEGTPEPRRRRPVVVRDMKFWRDDTLRRNSIKIERYPDPFYMSFSDPNDRLEWVKWLALAGGHHVEEEMRDKNYLKNIPLIARTDLAEWSPVQVKEWLGYQTFGKNQPFGMYEENFEGLSGADLDSLVEGDLMQRGITNLPHRKKIMRAVREIRTKRIFNYAQHVVYDKVQNMTRAFGKVKNANWKFLSRSLSDPECMKETYLNPEILQDSLSRYMGDDRQGAVDSGDEVNLVADDVEEMSMRLSEQAPENFKLPVKLVVTEMVHSDGYKTARRLLSPVVNRLPSLKKTFGIFHTALIVGPWYLEWTDSSLCIPRKLYSSMALVSADIDTTTLLRNTTISEVSMKLARVICRWNAEMTYCNVNMRQDPTKGNCQEFIEDLMATLTISLRAEGAFGQFLQKMKMSGQCDLTFTPSPGFRDHFRLQVNEYKFETHSELDEFVYGCAEVDEIALTMDYKEEHKLLKSFDRAFWLRHFKKPDMDMFRPSPRDCPFDDPRRTKSYMTYT